MSDVYTTLNFSPRKKRYPSSEPDDHVLTPKKFRVAPRTPPSSRHRVPPRNSTSLPINLARILSLQTALQHAISHALATCAISPTSESGLVRNVLNHLSIKTYAGPTTSFQVDDLRRLCWVWEWDAKSLLTLCKTPPSSNDDDNPFLDNSSSSEWKRGSMGIIISPTTHYSKLDRKRVPAYGIGIEVEMDLDKDMGGGMAAVARWTSASDQRRSEFRSKLERWVELHADQPSVPDIPLADLPRLSAVPKVSSLTKTLASCSPSSSTSKPFFGPPSSPTREVFKTPSKKLIPFPIASSRPISPIKKSSTLLPQTPRHRRVDSTSSLLTPQTPSSAKPPDSSEPSTPVHQRGSSASTAPETPSSSRRQALYERVRQKSLSASPTKATTNELTGGKLSRDQLLKMGQGEMRRRCILGRLGGVAESVWMLFSTPSTGTTASPMSRKRRAMPLSEVTAAVIKSSPVPISNAEAKESLVLLTKLCPFFLKQLNITGVEWLEMPASTPSVDKSPTKPRAGTTKVKEEVGQELITRSPRRVKKEAGGLREVREIIRRELELQD